MCGIGGIIGDHSNTDAKKLISLLKHRGPDDDGFWNDKKVLLVATRLMITSDKKEGIQPFVKDGYILIYNGEIFNYQRLKDELKKSCRFSTNTDTEVLMNGLINERESFIRKLDGQFAFAFYDLKRKKVLLARDQIGRMPLYYTQAKDGRFIFASEMKAIFSVDVKAKLKGGDKHFKYQWSNQIPTTNNTIFEKVYQLLPGQIISIDLNGERTIRKSVYYELNQSSILNKPQSYFLSRLPELLKNSVNRELIGHAKIGLSFSGGVDSTIILKILSEKLDYPPVSIAAFRDEKYFDTVREASRLFNTKLVEIKLDKKIVKELPKTIYATETYGMGHGIELLHFNISKEAQKQKVKVLMCGAGIDEEFLGYWHFLKHTFDKFKNRGMLEKELIKERHQEIKQLYNSHLLVRDRTRMAHGIEARSPFVNVPLIESALKIPPFYCVDSAGGVKKIMRTATAEFLPKKYAYMKKIQSYTHSNIFSILQEELGLDTNEEYLTLCKGMVEKIFVDGKNPNTLKI
ncbi:MAG TPA: asparagine synthase-related protein [Candidatus Nanoarchaeia archaeon]|nr:asparagine synthase-related protein [Candidatus Nanoarchaeia archaeon]